jgi:DNA transformation protein
MAVTKSYQMFVLEQLNRAVPPVRARAMFGGAGLYARDVFFALIANDIVYLRTDDSTRPEFEALGMEAFRPHGDDSVVMRYHQLPEEILEDPDRLRSWAERAIAAARDKPKKRPARRR